MSSFAEKPVLDVVSASEWEHWLETVADPDGVRLKLRKKAAVAPGITRQEALDVALCFGWIDGQGASFDDEFSLQAYTPRRRSSPWSEINREHAHRLIAEGRMRPGGHAEIDRAKADGRWDSAYRQKGAPVPDDFQAALDENPPAAAFFADLTGSRRFAFLFRIGSAKRPDTRAKRIAQFVDVLARGETLP